jgi:hypothetical protein
MAQPLNDPSDVSGVEVTPDQLSDHKQFDEILKRIEANLSTRAESASDIRRHDDHLIPRPQAARRHPGQGGGAPF